MRVVLDTNVLARIPASPQGPAGELFDRICADHLLVLSSEMLTELSRMLGYERLRRIHQLDDAAIKEFVEHVEAGSLVVPLPDPLPRVVPHDPDDDAVIATAMAGSVEVLCTLDKHLRTTLVVDYCRQHGIRVLTDVELLQELRAATP
jgi:putative PIN family toxin of toxin-antitoxin system